MQPVKLDTYPKTRLSRRVVFGTTSRTSFWRCRVKLPRGLTHDASRDQFRVQITSRHTQPQRRYREWLPKGTTRRQAETYLAKLREGDRMGTLIWPSERETEKPPARPCSVGDFAREIYLPHASTTGRPATLEYKQFRVLSLSETFWSTPLTEVTHELVIQHQAHLRSKGAKASTINHDITVLNQILHLAHQLDYLPHPPAKFKKLKESDKKDRRALTLEEAQDAIDRAFEKGQVWGTVALFLLNTGARWRETRDLRWADLDLDQGEVRFKASTAKQGKARRVPLHPDAADALRLLPRLGEWVFMWEGPRSNLAQLRYNGRAGLSYAWGDFGPHTFRHTFATWKLRAGVPIALVSRWLGHASIQMTVDIYGHIDGGEHREEMLRGDAVSVRKLRAVK